MSDTRAAIIFGTPDLDTPRANAVVHIKSPTGVCSGTIITSSLALTAVHCQVTVGSKIWVGLENPNAGPANPLASRVVQKVWQNVGSVSKSLSDRARDVAVVRFSPPITMEATAQRPTFQRPTLTTGQVSLAVFHGGIAGYGLDATITFDADGGAIPSTFYPLTRQYHEQTSFAVTHVDAGQGFAVWMHVVPSALNVTTPHAAAGDSGGPLYRVGSYGSQLSRDVLGVCSYTKGDPNHFPCPDEICGEEQTAELYADITAPAMKAWIESVVDRNSDGRWEGQTDYTRQSPGTPGCDVASNPSCDPSCDPVADPDCDFVNTPNDNCPNDYNPDQLNSDDPNDIWDRASALDPGDPCDVCPSQLDNGDNCNSDSEVLTWGVRPFVREDDVIGNPISPAPAPVVGLNSLRYRGDACDPAACTDLAKRDVELPGKYGKPDAFGSTCVKAPLVGGHCAFTATSRIARDGRVSSVLNGFKGDTGYRFCRCDQPRITQAQRINNCILAAPGCARTAADFTTHGNSYEMSASPAFPAITPLESGTAGDVFTAAPKTVPATFDWLFEDDMLAITGQPKPPLPLTDATASTIAIDGLLASSVRSFPFFAANPDRKDRAFHWLPMALRVEASIIDVSPMPDAIVYPGWWQVPCKFIPDCKFGFSQPWLVIPPPLSLTPVWGATPDVTADLTPAMSPAVLPLLQGTFGAPTRALVPAAEHDSTLSARGGALAPRAALVDLASRVFLGGIAQTTDGRLLPVRGRTDATGELAMLECSDPAHVTCSLSSGSTSSPPTVATLSGVRRTLFLLAGPVGAEGPQLLVFDLLAEQWSEVGLSGAPLAEVPLAMTYDAQADCLFALSRAQQAGGLVRLSRIRFDGRVETLAQGLGYAHDATAFLTATERGELLLSISRKQAQAPFKIARVRPFGSSAKVLGVYQGKGRLVAAPFLTERALSVATAGAQGASFAELPLSVFDPPSGVGLDSTWK